MGAQRLDGVVTAGKFGFGQRGMDFGMADLVQKNGRPLLSAAQTGDEMMQALRRLRRDRAVAKRADRRFGHLSLRQTPVWRRLPNGQEAS